MIFKYVELKKFHPFEEAQYQEELHQEVALLSLIFLNLPQRWMY